MASTFFDHLVSFISQSDSGMLGNSGYPRVYRNFAVKFGFGQGNSARVTWISFTAFNQSVQEGIYPVFLYYKNQKLLILAYGVSATRPPHRKWTFKEANTPSVLDFFRSNGLGRPLKYEESYVYKHYRVSSPRENYGLNEQTIVQDLDALVDHYKEVFSTEPPKAPDPDPIIETPLEVDTPIELPEKAKPLFDISSFLTSARSANFMITEHLATRYVASLLTKPFVILTGLSGSGKTKLAQLFAEWICASEDQYRLVPVGADWTNREPLLGYPNALDESKYVSPDNRVLELIIAAQEDPDKPYFLILDEMNMSHVERYFADFLSAMESGREIFLHSGKAVASGIPASIGIPSNLFIVGTVNVDETTYMFSPKVLDRASVIEFRVSEQDMGTYLESNSGKALQSLNGEGATMAIDFLLIRELAIAADGVPKEALMKFFVQLREIGAEFGYRSAAEINRFYSMTRALAPEMEPREIIDYAILQKLLPKVHGSRRKLESVLKRMAALCVEEAWGKDVEDFLKAQTGSEDLADHILYPESLTKIKRMYRSMTDNGFTSFAEA